MLNYLYIILLLIMSKKIFVDIDNTICFTNGWDYEKSIPNVLNIKKVNKYYNDGHNVIYWSARGSSRGLERDLLDRIDRLREIVKKHDDELNRILKTSQLDNRVENLIEQAESVNQQWSIDRNVINSLPDGAIGSLIEYLDDVVASVSKTTKHDDPN